MTGTIKGFKVTDNSRHRLFGVACKSLKELVLKGSKKLQMSGSSLLVFLQDGTIVDDEEYFSTLPQQSLLVLAKPGTPVKTGSDLIYDVLKTTNVDLLKTGESVSKFFQEDIKEKLRVLSNIIKITNDEEEENTVLWFAGVETNCKTKEAYMESRCRDRIRGFYYKTASSLKLSNEYASLAGTIEKILGELKSELQKNHYEGCYFNRLKIGSALCDKEGNFTCGGTWCEKRCKHNKGNGHKINPYLSRELRIIFSTWNLDHRIERSRSIIPSLLTALMSVDCSDGRHRIDSSYLYKLLFTKHNLKLVHIVCHDKGSHHSAPCDPASLIIGENVNGYKNSILGSLCKRLITTAK